VLVSKITEKLESSLFPQTTSIYRCSNSSCQEKKDKEAMKRIEMQKEKDSADERRNLARALHSKAS
jgi:aspartate carbamoyltransferase regulatory subunit